MRASRRSNGVSSGSASLLHATLSNSFSPSMVRSRSSGAVIPGRFRNRRRQRFAKDRPDSHYRRNAAVVANPAVAFVVFRQGHNRISARSPQGLPQPRVSRYLARPIRLKWHAEYEPWRELPNLRASAARCRVRRKLHSASKARRHRNAIALFRLRAPGTFGFLRSLLSAGVRLTTDKPEMLSRISQQATTRSLV